MSRDRLAALRAQRSQQQQQQDAQTSSNGYDQDYAGYSEPSYPQQQGQSSYPNAYQSSADDSYGRGYDQPASHVTNQNQYYGQAQPGGGGGDGQGYGYDDEDARGQRARDERRRRPSQSAGAYNDQQTYGRSHGGRRHQDQGIAASQQQPRSLRKQQGQQQNPSCPRQQDDAPYRDESQLRTRQDVGPYAYGQREDNSPYYEKNASQVALSRGYSADEDEKSDYKAGYPPASQGRGNVVRDLTGYDPEPQTYAIPSLPKNGYGDGAIQSGSRSQTQRPPQNYSPSAASAITPDDPNVVSNAPIVDMTQFFDEIASVREAFKDLDNHIAYLDQLHSRNLTGAGGQEVAQELEEMSDQTRRLTNSLRNRIKALQETTRIRTHGKGEQDRQTRKAQIGAVRERFLEIVQSYQNMEMRNRDKAKQKIGRQYQIVRPEASPEEIRQVVDGGQEVQVFAQALRQTTRVKDARGVLNDVQNRHEDIKKIERTLVELFHLFQDFAIQVEEQDEQIVHIEQKAEEVSKDMETGFNDIKQGVVSAKKARKKRKICFIILVILLLITAGIIVYVVLKIVIPKINKDKEAAAAKTTVTATATTTRVQSVAAAATSNVSNSNVNNAIRLSTNAGPAQTANVRHRGRSLHDAALLDHLD